MLSSLRRELRARRRAMPAVRRTLANRAIVRHLRNLPAFRRARRVALYLPADGEVDLRSLEEHARARGKLLYLPVVGQEGAMSFAPWPRGGMLRRNRYGIPEPRGARRRSLPARRMDLVIMPLVGFDALGNRLGMGGGYYDRALAGRPRPVLVGAAFGCQRVAELPAQPWDVPLDLIVTERGWLRPRRRPAASNPQGTGAGE